MREHIYRSIREPIREHLTFAERWRGPDKGLITCWEVGRKLSESEPGLAERAKKGELPVLGWKGGVTKKIANKIGTFQYLAQWQGLRGEDLDIDLSKECILICSKTETKVNFINNSEGFSDSQEK